MRKIVDSIVHINNLVLYCFKKYLRSLPFDGIFSKQNFKTVPNVFDFLPVKGSGTQRRSLKCIKNSISQQTLTA